MKRYTHLAILGAAALLVGAAGYWLGSHRAPTMSMDGSKDGAHGAGAEGSADQREVLYWYDPMYPNRHFDAPGKSPFMDMALVPRYASEGQGAGVRIDPEVAQNLGVRVAPAERTTLTSRLEAVGTLGFNDRALAVVQSRTDGFVERVYDRAPGDLVNAGAPLADLLVPAWTGAQAEFLALVASADATLIEAGRRRLQLLGMPDALIRRVEQRGAPDPILTITAPIAGALRSLEVRRGMTVRAGETLARINGLGTVWLDVAVPEALAERVAVGAPARAHLPAFPARLLEGEVVDILPTAETRTRTVTVRVELDNADGRLRPGLFARADIGAPTERTALTVPSEAVIRTGERTLVMLAQEQGRYLPAEVVTGAEAGPRTVILAGLRENEQVVVSGQFLLDSEASLLGVPVRPAGDVP